MMSQGASQLKLAASSWRTNGFWCRFRC